MKIFNNQNDFENLQLEKIDIKKSGILNYNFNI